MLFWDFQEYVLIDLHSGVACMSAADLQAWQVKWMPCTSKSLHNSYVAAVTYYMFRCICMPLIDHCKVNIQAVVQNLLH
jgi:hypothetical protein